MIILCRCVDAEKFVDSYIWLNYRNVLGTLVLCVYVLLIVLNDSGARFPCTSEAACVQSLPTCAAYRPVSYGLSSSESTYLTLGVQAATGQRLSLNTDPGQYVHTYGLTWLTTVCCSTLPF